jgi:hypothetical protein
MASAGLSYDQAPPLGLPLRFFLIAPLFLILAAAAALVAGPDIFTSRWNPATLAVTHLLTLGFLGMTMVGALLQMMPVVLGARLPAVSMVAWAGLLGLAAGSPLLAASLADGNPFWMLLAALVLAFGLLPFLAAMLIGASRSNVASVVAWPMRQAWLSLLLVLALGLLLVLALTGHAAVPDLATLADLHLAWGLGGWVLILITGVAYQVVPMLQLTPAYPARVARWLTWWMIFSLAGLSLVRFWPDAPAWLALLPVLAAAGGALSFALVTLWLQKRRRRKLGDATLYFWRFGMASLAVFAIALPFVQDDRLQIVMAMLFLLGFAASVVNGMLYKIVPFLAWFHLQAQKPGQAGSIPNMKQFVPEAMARRHLYVHGSGVLLCLAAPWLAWPVGQAGLVLLMASGGMLWLNLMRARRLFLSCGGRL